MSSADRSRKGSNAPYPNTTRYGSEALAEIPIRQRQPDLADQVKRFADDMAPPMTEKKAIAAQLLARAREQPKRSETHASR